MSESARSRCAPSDKTPGSTGLKSFAVTFFRLSGFSVSAASESSLRLPMFGRREDLRISCLPPIDGLKLFMDISAYCRQLVAQYLNANGDAGNFSNNLHLLILAVDFPNTLSAFKTEASPIASTSNSTINLEQLVEAWLAEQALLGNSGLASVKPPLPSPAAFDWHKEISPALPTAISRTLRNVHLSSILSVGTCYLPKRVFDTTSASYRSERVQCIVTSSTDKRVAFTNTLTWSLEDDFQPSKSATLAVKINPVYPLMLSGAMDGTYSIINLLTRKMESIKEHAK